MRLCMVKYFAVWNISMDTSKDDMINRKTKDIVNVKKYQKIS